ncbi:MAG: MerR family transcriptional regulator [Ignavibacteria bacterium]|nr:MerR family transcriptional regulator [Ignavibacteria bacterium]
MKNNFYTEEELLNKISLSTKDFEELKSHALIAPVIKNKGNTALYDSDSILALEKIIHLKELGYGIEEIKKIIKKVGLPVKSEQEQKAESLNFITIGELSEKIGVNARTLKHWEEKGIIEPDARSEGGVRLYQEIYVFFGELILDLQMFGYSLDEIKEVSDMFRDFVALSSKENIYPLSESVDKLKKMQEKITNLYSKIKKLTEGIERWDELLKKKKKEINQLLQKYEKQNPKK